MAVGVVDPLEEVDVDHEDGEGLAALRHALHQRFHVRGQIAPVVEPRQTVGQGQRQLVQEAAAQPVLVALAADLGAHPRQQLVLVDGAGDVVVDPQLQGADQAIDVVFLADQKDGKLACLLQRAQQGTQAQGIVVGRGEPGDQNVGIDAAHQIGRVLETVYHREVVMIR